MLYQLMRAYYFAARDYSGTASNEKRVARYERAMLLTDQFCTGDLVSNASAPASAYRQYHMGTVILTRIYHKLFFTRQYAKAHELAEYLKLLVQSGVIEIDSKGNETKAIRLVGELRHTVALRATSLIVSGITKLLLAEPVTS